MGEENDLEVAKQLSRIETQLEIMAERLFGDVGDPQGGLIGNHDKRLARLEVWLVRIASGLVVFNFLTGSGPATLGAIVKVFTKTP